ncbi:hypothetical protein RF11_16356 [Thelohanellus kitauei]|uniref:Uncharacterized protein n=1 Tax=Thelohanellus kitauei TaxID=669202 RepID=A0A0C2MGU0_THEKT|nr:hypothetical protein RF11_16356 [Thelohanellus kitauei]
MILGIWHHENGNNITTKLFHQSRFGARADMTHSSNFKKYFFLHGNLYTYGLNNKSTLCLYTINKYDYLVRLICNLSKYDTLVDKCPFVINPHLPGVIYVNLMEDDLKTWTYISVDHGKHFSLFELTSKSREFCDNKCRIELDLPCGNGFINNNFPEKWIAKFNGTLEKDMSLSHHTFISYDGGLALKIFNQKIRNLVILNREGVILGTQSMDSQIVYSYDLGFTWESKYIDLNNLIEWIPIEVPKYLVITAINFNAIEDTYSVYTFDFSPLIS